MLRLSFYAAAALTIAAVTFFGAYRYAHTSANVTPQDADVNKDGAVTIADAISVLPHIGQLAPTPTPQTVRTYVMVAYASPTCNLNDGSCYMAEAFCDPGDPASGGGLTTTTTSSAGIASYPVTDTSGRSGWHGEARNTFNSTQVVCIDNPPAHTP